MTEKKVYQVVGATQFPLLKMGLTTPILASDGSYFEFGAYDSYRFSKELFDNSVEVGCIVGFDEPIDFPGTEEDAKFEGNEEEQNKRGYTLLYISDELKKEFPELVRTIDESLKSNSTARYRKGYTYYLLSDAERTCICKGICKQYEVCVQKKMRRAGLIFFSSYSTTDRIGNELKEVNTNWKNTSCGRRLLCPIDEKARDSIRDDYACLLRIAPTPELVKKYLPYFLLMDGNESWDEEDWEGLSWWAEDYGRKAGIGSEFDKVWWKQERVRLLESVFVVSICTSLKYLLKEANALYDKVSVHLSPQPIKFPTMKSPPAALNDEAKTAAILSSDKQQLTEKEMSWTWKKSMTEKKQYRGMPAKTERMLPDVKGHLNSFVNTRDTSKRRKYM
ncbi:MAG: hypothetical protein ACRC10_07945 [Thermoguttaceae bacterium]